MDRFKIDQQGIRALAAHDNTGEAMLSAANTIRRVVQAIAPRSSDTYAKSIKAEDGDLVDGARTARVTTTATHWHWVEYGAQDTPAYRPMMNGVMRAGARWEDNGP